MAADGRGLVRPRLIALAEADADRVEGLLAAELAGRMQARLGSLVDGLEGDGRVALDESGSPVGLVTWLVGSAGSGAGEAEVRILAVAPEARRRGIGGALLAAAEAELIRAGVRRAWLVTTNDNIEALAFYQRHGWRLAELHPGAVDASRRTIKPAISAVAENGIPIRDELVLAKEL